MSWTAIKQESLAVTVADKNIAEMCDMSVGEMVSFLETMELSERQKLIGEQVLKEIKARIGFLNDVGLDYLTLSKGYWNIIWWRSAANPSGNTDRFWISWSSLYLR